VSDREEHVEAVRGLAVQFGTFAFPRTFRKQGDCFSSVDTAR